MNHHDPGDSNVERLIRVAYTPDALDPEFVRRVTARVQSEAAIRAHRAGNRWRWLDRRRVSWAAAAAILIGLTFGAPRILERSDAVRHVNGGMARVTPGERLTARPRPPAPEPERIAIHETVRTNSTQTRRLVTPGGSVLYLNRNTTVTIDSERHLTLTAGEVFLEVTAKFDRSGRVPFTIATPDRRVEALGTRFAVRAAEAGTGVVVTQGKVQVSGVEDVVTTGQQVIPGSARVEESPRVSASLDWLSDLVGAEDGVLVPTNTHAGGDLVAFDPDGQEAKISLRKYHVDIHIEDGFARATIDQTYFNQETTRLEGTFFFPLPSDASLSRLAMYVDGTLMEGGMAERDYARSVFETIVRRQKDPALLEWVDGSTFKMRVFPMEPRQEKRILLCYTQKLPSLYGTSTYRFPAGHSLRTVREWSMHARVKDGANVGWNCPSHDLQGVRDGRDLVLDGKATDAKVDRDVVLELIDREQAMGESVAFASTDHDGSRYLMLRYRPSLPGTATKQRRDWVFLFESSADRDPLLARTQIEILRNLLENAEHDDTFSILAAGTNVRRFANRPKTATAENIRDAVAWLERVHLIGALDLQQALTTAAPLLKSARNPHLVHLGSARPRTGASREDELLKLLPAGTRYVGVGVGKRWNRGFMKAAAERTGGFFTQINPDERIAWRAFDLLATLNTPRLLDVRVGDPAGEVTYLCHSTMVSQGEELCAVAKIGDAQTPLPGSVTVTGTLDGKPFRRSLAVNDVTPNAGPLPRTWAKLEIERLLAEDPAKNKDAIVSLSKAMYVMTPYTSLLVLENEAMYREFKVDRGRKDHWAMYPAPEKIDVLYEPQQGPEDAVFITRRKSATEQDLSTVIVSTPTRVLNVPGRRRPDADMEKGISVGDEWNYGATDASGNPAGGNGISVGDEWEYRGYISGPVSADGDWKLGYYPPARALRNWSGDWREGFSGRSGTTRVSLLREGGGTTLSEAGVASGLTWLARHQAPDGHWSLDQFHRHTRVRSEQNAPFFDDGSTGQGVPNDIAATALALLPFLASGETHKPSVRSPSPHTSAVARGLQWLLARQNPNGDFGGGMYAHALATTAICEAFAMTSDEAIKAQVERAVDFILRTQDSTGCWRADARRAGDPVLFAWQVLALKSAQMSGLRRVSRECFRKASDWLTSRAEAKFHDTPTTVAALLFARLYLGGWWPGSPEVREALQQLRRTPPETSNNIVYTFFATQVFHHLGGEAWETWNPRVRDHLILTQDRGTDPDRPLQKGSWDPRSDVQGRQGGRVMQTALSLLTLEVYYRYLPLYRRQPFRPADSPDTATALYQRPHFSGDQRIFRDLLAHAPGLRTTAADLRPGTDSEPAAPSAGWQTVTVRDPERGDSFTVLHDGTGRFMYQRLLPSGLTEEVVCDGKTLWHIYRELGVAARRTFSRGHRDEFASLLRFASSAKPCPAPDLTPDLRDLLILPLPVRTPEYVLATLAPRWDGRPQSLSDDALLSLLTAKAARGEDCADLAKEVATRRGSAPLGLVTVLAAAGAKLPDGFLSDAQKQTPLVRYLQWAQRQDKRPEIIEGLGDGVLQRLAAFRELAQPWREDRPEPVNNWEYRSLLGFVRDRRSPELTWALIDLVLSAKNRIAVQEGERKALPQRLLEEAALPADTPLGITARYELASRLLASGDPATARRIFLDIYATAMKAHRLPPVDPAFRQALEADRSDAWRRLLRQTASTLVQEDRLADLLTLVRQCAELDERGLADEFLQQAIDRLPAHAGRLVLTLDAIAFLRQTHQTERAERLLESLLTDPAHAKRAGLWRFAAKLAAEGGRTERALACLDRALDLEFKQLPDVIDLHELRRDYGDLLTLYEENAADMTARKQAVSREFVAAVVRVADRWRSLDVEPSGPCHAAARVLTRVGENDLAWEYLSTAEAGGDR